MSKVPKWVGELGSWWNELLGPVLDTAWSRVKATGEDPALLQAAYSEVVNRMDRAMDEADAAVADLAMVVGQDQGWAPVVSHVRDVMAKIRGRWTDPSASVPIGVSGHEIGVSVAFVVTTAKRLVSAVGIAWALSTVAHVELLISWVREQTQAAQAGQAPPRVRRGT